MENDFEQNAFINNESCIWPKRSKQHHGLKL